jgi:hypothetical protein
LPFVNIDDAVDYGLAINGIDGSNSCKIDITKFITKNIKLELRYHNEDCDGSNLSQDIDADAHHYNTLLNRSCEYHETPSLQTHLDAATAQSFLHINARSLIKKPGEYFK